MATDQNNMTGQNGMGNGSSGYGGMSGQMQGGSMMRTAQQELDNAAALAKANAPATQEGASA